MDKKVLITGASQGIGLAIAIELANEGHRLTLVGRDKGKLEKALNKISGQGHQVFEADLSRDEGIQRLCDKIFHSDYDVLINNAGVGLMGKFEELNIESQMAMMKLNCDALIRLSHSFSKKAKSGDALVNVASTLGLTSFPGLATYAGTKAFVVNFSQSLWYEYRKREIFVTAICPGVTATQFHESGGGSLSDYPKAIIQTPEQVAKEVVRALKARKRPTTVTGFMNRMMLFMFRFMPRKTAVSIMGSFVPLKQV